MSLLGLSSLARSPLWLVGLGLGLSLLLLGVAAAVTARLHGDVGQRSADAAMLESSLQEIEFAGSMASVHRELAIASREEAWAETYRRSADRLVAALEAGEGHASSLTSKSGLRKADSLNALIMDIERRAIHLALGGSPDSARGLVEDPSFARLVSAYGDALLHYSRAPGRAGQLQFVLDVLDRVEAESQTLVLAGLPETEGTRIGAAYLRELRSRIAASTMDAAGSLSIDVVTNVLSSFDDFGAALGTPDAPSRHADFLAASFDLRRHVHAVQNRVHAEAVWRSRGMAALYVLFAILLVVTWITVVRLIRRAIADQTAAEQRLMASDARNAALLAAVPDLIFVLDRHGTYLDCHVGEASSLLMPLEQFLGRRMQDVMPPAFVERFSRCIEDTLRLKEPTYFDYDLEINGRTQWFEAWVAPEGNDRLLTVVRDITDRRKADQTIREGEARFQSLVENSLVGTYIFQNGQITYVNPRLAELLGYSVGDLVGRSVSDVLMPADALHALENEHPGEPRTVHTTIYGMHADGYPLTLEVFGSSMEIASSPAVIGTVLDVTEREKAREQVSALKTFYEETLDRLPIEVVVLDQSLRFRYLNPAAVKDDAARYMLIGAPIERLPDLTNFSEERLHQHRQWLQDVLDSGKTLHMEEDFTDVDGAMKTLLRVAAPVHDSADRVRQVVAYALDISDRKHFEGMLVDAKERAEQMARMKSAFLANMSHEIRTPLTGILGFASLLEEEVAGEQRQFVSLILRSGKRLLDTLNAVLDLSRLEAGEMRLDPRPMDIRVETEEIASYLNPLADEKGLELTVEVPDEEVRCFVDPSAFHIILNNLIGNAIKFTPSGQVRVTVLDGDRFGVVEVRDTGVGIDDAFLPELFEEFKQESVGLTRSHEGAGLGLAITRRLVHLLKGTIEVESAKDYGTTFRVSLPRAARQLDLPLDHRHSSGNGTSHALDTEHSA
jgi:PAS domain S-box-containing protein